MELNEKLHPSATLEDQEALENMEMEPVVIGPGAYGSPEGEGLANRQLVETEPQGLKGNERRQALASGAWPGETTETPGGGGEAASYDDMSKADLKRVASEREIEVTREDGKDGEPTVADYRRALTEADAEDMNSRDFIERVNDASSEEELEAAENFYVDSGKSYTTVDRAIEKKREELSGNGDES